MRSWPEIGRTVLLAAAFVVLLTPSGAGAEQVVNGGFESGTLNGWNVYQANPFGDWFAYQGTETPIGANRKKQGQGRDVQPPPQGAYAAVTDEVEPDTLILYQDVTLPPGSDYQLSLIAYYDSYKPIAIPTPDTLSIGEEALRLPNGQFQKNQQFRIDVMRPEAPLESLEPSDVLRKVFATKLGDRPTMAPTKFSVNLSPFAGQTVRLRIADTVTEEVFNAGVDSVSIPSAPGGFSSSHRRFRFGKPKVNRRNGTATLRVSVVGSGLLRAAKAPAQGARGEASGVGKAGGPIEPVTVPVATARTVTLHLRPTPATRAALRRKHELRVRVGLTYMPTAGLAETASTPVVFRLAPRHG
jgi:hypothetical protein